MLKHVIFLLCAVLAVWAYLPSLRHAPKHDQLAYLAEMAGKTDACAITLGSYSLNRTRSFMWGDQILFRPLLNIWLGVQRVSWGYHFTWWQLTSVLLHLGVGVALYRVLIVLHAGVPAAMASGGFLLMIANVPMVVWHHVSGYMLYSILVLEALRQIFQYYHDDQESHLWKGSFLLGLAGFFFEIGILLSVITFLFIGFRSRRWSIAAIFLLPVVVFLTTDLVDLFVFHPGLNMETVRISVRLFSWDTVLNFLTAIKWMVTTGVFLGPGAIFPVERVAVAPWTLRPDWPFMFPDSDLWRGLWTMVTFGLLLAGSGRFWAGKRREPILLSLAMALAMVVFICVGRVNTRGIITGLFFNSYYIYFFWVFFMITLYAALDFPCLLSGKRADLLKINGIVLAVLVLGVSAFAVRQANTLIAVVDAPRRQFLDGLTDFVAAHHQERDFTFFVPPTSPGNYAGKWLHRKGDPLWRRYTLAEALFPEYYRPRTQAKYRLQVLSVPKAE